MVLAEVQRHELQHVEDPEHKQHCDSHCDSPSSREARSPVMRVRQGAGDLGCSSAFQSRQVRTLRWPDMSTSFGSDSEGLVANAVAVGD